MRHAVLPALLLLVACADPAPEPVATAPGAVPAPAPAATDWRPCRLPGAGLPVPGKLFVIDGGRPTPGAEPGRESIRRVEVAVPGPVALLLTAPDPTVWLVRVSPETQLQAVYASGDAPQRITGQGLEGERLAVSRATGAACAGYLLPDGAGPALAEASEEVFGRRWDALYTMRIGVVVIGGTEGMEPDG